MLLTLENFTKSYGEKTLFSGVDFSIDDGERVGIVGVNGTGKSTFLKAVAGLTPVDDGTRVERRGLRMEMLAQDKVFAPENTVLMEVFRGTSPLMQALRDYELALRAAEERPDDTHVQQALAKCSAAIDAAEGWQLESEAKTVLTQLGITDFAAPVGTLSGGEQKRLALATALVQPCDLLLLDEPTNHLDSETIAWLETYLSGRKGALLMVTHDRYFLDRTATKILELDKGHAYTYTGNYSDFLEQKAARIEREQASEAKRQNFLRNELKWLRRGAQARSTKQKARIERYEEVKAQTPDLDRSTVEIGLAGSRLGRTVIELDHVHYEVDGQTIVKDFSYTVLRHDRVAILGRNGTGKTTLLDLIAGRLQPMSGTVKIGQTVKIGYFTQKAVEMDERLRAIEYIEEAAHTITLADGQTISASQLMERFLFPGSLQWTPIARLSGGEKRRLYLLRILMESPNVLLLDEPTNDLDLETMAVLESFIDDFSGAILIVSHDRFFIERFATRIWTLENGRFTDFRGAWKEYGEWRERQAVFSRNAEKAEKKEKRDTRQPRPANADRQIARTEREIAALEEKLAALAREEAENASDYQKLMELGSEKEELEEELMALYEKWEELNG